MNRDYLARQMLYNPVFIICKITNFINDMQVKIIVFYLFSKYFLQLISLIFNVLCVYLETFLGGVEK